MKRAYLNLSGVNTCGIVCRQDEDNKKQVHSQKTYTVVLYTLLFSFDSLIIVLVVHIR